MIYFVSLQSKYIRGVERGGGGGEGGGKQNLKSQANILALSNPTLV